MANPAALRVPNDPELFVSLFVERILQEVLTNDVLLPGRTFLHPERHFSEWVGNTGGNTVCSVVGEPGSGKSWMLRRILDHLRENPSNLILPIDLENSSEKDILQRLSDCTKAWSREINGKADLVDGERNKLLPLPANSEDEFIHNWQACCETLANYTGPVVLAVDGLDHFDDENWKQIERLLVYPFQAMTSRPGVRFKIVLLHRYLDELKTPHLKSGAKYYKVVYMDEATGRLQITQICNAILQENGFLAGRSGSGGPDNDYHMRLKEILPLEAPDAEWDFPFEVARIANMTEQEISDVGARLTGGNHVYKSPYANVLVFAQSLAPNTWPLSKGDFDMVIDRYLGRGASEMTVMKEQLAAFTRENGGRGKARILNGHGLSSDKLLIGRTAFISFDSGERVYVLDPTLVTLFNQRESAPSG